MNRNLHLFPSSPVKPTPYLTFNTLAVFYTFWQGWYIYTVYIVFLMWTEMCADWWLGCQATDNTYGISPSSRMIRLMLAFSFLLVCLCNNGKSLLLLLKQSSKIHYKATVFCEPNPAHYKGSSSLLSWPKCQIQRLPFFLAQPKAC